MISITTIIMITIIAVFTWASKEFRVCLGFALLRLVIGFKKKSRHFLNQSELKPKPIETHSRTFSCASRRLRVFASSFDWFNGGNFGFVFTILNQKLVYCYIIGEEKTLQIRGDSDQQPLILTRIFTALMLSIRTIVSRFTFFWACF